MNTKDENRTTSPETTQTAETSTPRQESPARPTFPRVSTGIKAGPNRRK